ncbi:MAG TPA: hypothetical protein DCS63_06025 [Elusimicrobia bacterium]|nr:hypothetical protein [Elusimicrobiota bacterium]
MSGTEDLKNLLNRLKDEVGPLPAEPHRPERPAPRADAPAQAAPRQAERFTRPHRPEALRESLPPQAGGSLAWSENKESMLFGMLAALIAVLGGILSGLDYLVLIGSVVFMLFSFMMLLALFGHYLTSRRRGPEGSGLAERVDALSRKVETLSGMVASRGGGAYQDNGPGRERELEHKVEELRVLVKTLSRAVEQQNR